MTSKNNDTGKDALLNSLNSPGSLRSEFLLTIQTREAQKLVAGRRVEIADPLHQSTRQVEHIMGLPSFGKRMSGLWVAAQYDDPYADWYLLQIETALNAAKNAIAEKTKELSQLLGNVDAIKIKASHSISPIEFNLSFANPYGYQGAYLIAEFDALACAVMTAWHIGLIDRKPKREILASASKLIRRAFLLSTRWQFTGATRTAIRANEQTAQEAQIKMGILPQEILDLKQRAKIAPEIRSAHAFVLPTTSEGLSKLTNVPEYSFGNGAISNEVNLPTQGEPGRSVGRKKQE